MNSLKYFAIFCLLIFCNSRLFGQISYTDIPDATPNATFPLDLNNDSIDDFIIQMGATDKIVCFPQNNNAYAGEFNGANYFPWALNSNASICDTLSSWYGSDNPGFLAISSSVGNWLGQTDKYLALKLNVGTNTYYGWVRLDVVTTATSFTVKDYAYESTPNACILTGQTPLGIAENSLENNLLIAPNPFNSFTKIQTRGHFNNGILRIYNAFGETIQRIENYTGDTITLSRDKLPSGVYFVQLTSETKTLGVEKFIIID
ncbi:MAG: hypothetical protein RIT10_1738 [Bacteroidota bacterium]